VKSGHKNLLVVGYFNIHWRKNVGFETTIEEWADNFVLNQIINDNTRSRVVNGVQSSMIDLAFTNSSNLQFVIDHQNVSDHVLIKLSSPTYKNAQIKSRVNYYDWRSYNSFKLCQKVEEFLSPPLRQIVDPDLINDHFIHSLCPTEHQIK
jgi:hypothetical protein